MRPAAPNAPAGAYSASDPLLDSAGRLTTSAASTVTTHTDGTSGRIFLPRLVLDWPSKPLWPNRKAHWALNKRARDLQREAAFYTAKISGWEFVDFVGRVHLEMTFCPPTNRRFDLDGALSACKGAVDGMSAALGVDDSKFEFSLHRGEKCKDGAIIIIAEVA